MPNITVVRDHLFAAIGKTFTDEEFDDVCFSFGVEIDDVSNEIMEVRSCETSKVFCCALVFDFYSSLEKSPKNMLFTSLRSLQIVMICSVLKDLRVL